MSILLESNSGWIISHKKFFEKIKVQSIKQAENSSTGDYNILKLNPSLFEITEPFKEPIARKSTKEQLCQTAVLVKTLYESIINLKEAQSIFENEKKIGDNLTKQSDPTGKEEKDQSEKECVKSKNEPVSWPRNNFCAVKTTETFFEKVKDLKLPKFFGQNPYKNVSVISSVNNGASQGDKVKDNHQFIFPPNSAFHCKDVSEMKSIFANGQEENKFDLIIMDPPWWNKFIRRKKRKQSEAGYQMIDNEGLEKLPIKDILQDDGIVVVWCTNAKSHHDALKKFFSAWNVHFRHKLYWLKVTTSGLPVCPFNEENKKQPYETIFIGQKIKGDLSKDLNFDFDKDSDTPRLIISVPSSVNSHKPPLTEVLKRLYPNKEFNKKLEIFARYLMPDFTSFGNEVIKLQHLSLYIEDENQ